jgi:hypothetical protein
VRLSVRDGAGGRAARSVRVRLRRAAHLRRTPRRSAGRRSGRARGLRHRVALNQGPSDPLIGISDQHPATFIDPRFAALGITTARVIVPWNVMSTEPERLGEWLAAAGATGVEPLVVLEHARGTHCPDSPCPLPSVAEYAAAVRALLEAHPSLRLLTPWNEPNHRSQPTAGAPQRAAEYYNAARAVCPSCTLVAGDFLDASSFGAWMREYRRHLSEEPRVWGLHNYFDTTYLRSSGVERLLDSVPGDVWLTETGGIVSHGPPGNGLPADEARARRGVAHALALAAAHPDRVRRVYLYQWRAAADETFDAGLVRPDGSPRPAYDLLRQTLRAPIQASESLPLASSRSDVSIADRVQLTGRRLRVVLACAVAAPSACSGRLTVEGAAWRSGLLLNGHVRGRWIRPRVAPFSIAPGARRAMGVRLPARRLHGRVRLRLEHATPDGARGGRLVELRLR